MASQNLISATLAPETKTDVLQKLADIKSKMGFLLTLQPDQIQGLFKAGNSYAPFVDKAHSAINSNPHIIAGVFDLAEFNKDYALSKDLTAIVSEINQLADSLNNTLFAVNSDTMTAALDIYAAVKQNRDKVPGLNVVAEEMSEFFKKAKKKAAQPTR